MRQNKSRILILIECNEVRADHIHDFRCNIRHRPERDSQTRTTLSESQKGSWMTRSFCIADTPLT